MYELTLELLSTLADTENFVVHSKTEDQYAVDINESRDSIDREVFQHVLEKGLIKKLADLEDEDFYVISERGKEYLATTR